MILYTTYYMTSLILNAVNTRMHAVFDRMKTNAPAALLTLGKKKVYLRFSPRGV